MNKRGIDPTLKSEDWFGNNIAVMCPRCNKVYVVSDFLKEPGGKQCERQCPDCKKSTGVVHGAKDKGGEAYVIWDSN